MRLALIALAAFLPAACAPTETWVRATGCRTLSECQDALIEKSVAPTRMAQIERVSRMPEPEVRAELAR